jgi:hypothetical protein
MTKSGLAPAAMVVLGLTVSIVLFVCTIGFSTTPVVDPCLSSSYTSGPAQLHICPGGDGETLAEVGAVIYVQILDENADPIPMIPIHDFWLDGCSSGLALCPLSSWADSLTNANGETTISGTIRAGGCDTGIVVWVQGVRLVGGLLCAIPECLPIEVRSSDFNRDLVVDLIDLSRFARSYLKPTFEPCVDLNIDNGVDIIDLSIFAQHYLHGCF